MGVGQRRPLVSFWLGCSWATLIENRLGGLAKGNAGHSAERCRDGH